MEANDLAQSSSGYKDRIASVPILIRPYSSLLAKSNDLHFQVTAIDLEADWRIEIKEYLSSPSPLARWQIRVLATKMLLIDEELY